jgi:hypothetical protein
VEQVLAVEALGIAGEGVLDHRLRVEHSHTSCSGHPRDGPVDGATPPGDEVAQRARDRRRVEAGAQHDEHRGARAMQLVEG